MSFYCEHIGARFYLYAVDILYQHKNDPDFRIDMHQQTLFCVHFAAVLGLSRPRTTFRKRHMRRFIDKHHHRRRQHHAGFPQNSAIQACPTNARLQYSTPRV
jgi:hypothetical protein